ncbi:MAG: glutamine--fructose-6-phosphate transaminase (isomerizing) [Candidatus Brocadiae bacterium]|nr:glutamine--fructose-6-phosphate transaminase (isomerizing) [Candidatus Brocadiia bacterium]
MCGIIGYVGPGPAAPAIVGGLQRLDYRGYDSAGIVVLDRGRFRVEKMPGKLENLLARLKASPLAGTVGLGHTRWATHGGPTQRNAHPHVSGNARVAVVHNGIIENHEALRRRLRARGYAFRSETDTEVIAHLIEDMHRGNPLETVRRAIAKLEGSFAIGVLFRDRPDVLIGARLNSPLLVGFGEGANFLASDAPAVLPLTRRVAYLEDRELAELTPGGVRIVAADGTPREPRITHITWDYASAAREGYPHFMLKEIHEQPRALRDTIRGRTDHSIPHFPELEIEPAKLKRIRRVVITACGTAAHAGLVAKYAFEELARVPTEVVLASEFRYGDPVIGRDTLAVAVTQSGETMDTLCAIREARARGALTLAVCNVVGSSIPRAVDGTLYTHAGPEIGVASTKAYTTQIAVLELLAVRLGMLRGALTREAARPLLRALERVPDAVEKALRCEAGVRTIARRYRGARNFMYIGRRYNFPNAYEGALKLKELSYIHAEGYGAGEMKHGPLALVDNTFPTVAIATAGRVYEKMLSNMKEIEARGGILISIANPGDARVRELSRHVIEVPETPELVSPMVTAVPLQLLAYHIAVALRRDVDKPRNLAKAVTVE